MRLHRLNIGVTFVLGLLLMGAMLIVLPLSAQQTGPISASVSPGAAISDTTPAVSTLVVGQNAPITDVNVVVNITHSHSGDLRITLTHDSTGTSVTLLTWLNGPGLTYGCGSDGIVAVFDDAAGTAMDAYDCTGNFDGAVTGSWRPSGALSAFNGESVNGRWTLRVEDNIPSDNGILNSWGLVFNSDQPIVVPTPADDGVPVTPPPSADDLVNQILGGGGGAGGGASTCAAYDVATGQSSNIRTNNFDGMFDVYCRVIAEDAQFIRTGAEIGNKGVLDLGVLQAVDVYTTARTNPAGGEVCLRGEGDIIFLNAERAPRVPEYVNATINQGYTCVTLLTSGTVVLVGETPAVAQALVEEGRPVSVSAGTPLTGCRIRTNYALNIRTAPSLESVVIDRVPYQITLTATERTDEWFRVIYQDYQGWLNAGYLETIGTCG